jgi:hypothetical protein
MPFLRYPIFKDFHWPPGYYTDLMGVLYSILEDSLSPPTSRVISPSTSCEGINLIPVSPTAEGGSTALDVVVSAAVHVLTESPIPVSPTAEGGSTAVEVAVRASISILTERPSPNIVAEALTSSTDFLNHKEKFKPVLNEINNLNPKGLFESLFDNLQSLDPTTAGIISGALIVVVLVGGVICYIGSKSSEASPSTSGESTNLIPVPPAEDGASIVLDTVVSADALTQSPIPVSPTVDDASIVLDTAVNATHALTETLIFAAGSDISSTLCNIPPLGTTEMVDYTMLMVFLLT